MQSRKMPKPIRSQGAKQRHAGRSGVTQVDSDVCTDCYYRSTCMAGELVIALADEGCSLRPSDRIFKAKFNAHEPLFRVSTPFEALFMILSGSAKSCWLDEAGKEQIMGLYIPGDLLGLDAISPGFHPSSAELLQESDVCQIPFKLFERDISAVQRIKRSLIRQASRALRSEQMHSQALLNKNADQRMAMFLVDLLRRLENRRFATDRIVLSLSRRDIGNYLGLALGTVSRSFSRLQDAGLISLQNRGIVIHHPQRLAELASSPDKN